MRVHASTRDQTPHFLTQDGQWFRVLQVDAPTPERRRPALFLDRDGVLIEERSYLSDPDGVALIEGAIPTIAAARAAGHAIVVVTNQSGIGRGFFGWPQYAAVETRMLALLERGGAGVDAILACASHPQGGKPPYDDDHPWRKPRPGMLLAAAERLELDLAASSIVGDKAADIEAGRAAGLARGFHVATGHGDAQERRAALALAGVAFQVHACPSIAALATGNWFSDSTLAGVSGAS